MGAFSSAPARMAVGCPNPKTGKSERGGGQAHAHSIVGTKSGANERAAGIYPDLLRGTWDKNRITWSLAKGPTSSMIGDVEVRQSLERAFKVWERVADVKFCEAIIPPEDIEIRFENGAHSDGEESPCESFDGPGGKICFDDSKNWTLCTHWGINVFQVAVREIGHSLGLKYSDVPSAAMFPTYHGYKPDFKLDQDDIDAIQAIYGPPRVI